MIVRIMNLGLRQVRQVRDVFMFCRHWSLSRPRAVAVLRSLTTHNLLWGGVGVYLAVARLSGRKQTVGRGTPLHPPGPLCPGLVQQSVSVVQSPGV